jgi:histidinol-phosphate aminotransferase
MKQLKELVRENIWKLKPYSCARDEFKGEAKAYLDANENPFNTLYNRYPDPLQWAVKEKIAELKYVKPSQIMLGVGSDEPIDLIFRVFCEPKTDNVVAINPTYGMYGVCADINNVEYRQVNLEADYSLNADKVLAAVDNKTKVIFLCSPNNPTGNLLNTNEVEKILKGFDGIVVIDEAYIDFSDKASWISKLSKYPQMVILQTFSKAWGLAAARCGMAFASEEIISFFNKVKYPYNINILTQKLILEKLEQVEIKNNWVKEILSQRTLMIEELEQLSIVKHIYPSDANFILVKVDDANLRYKELVGKGIIVRNRNSVTLCENCLRITIGTAQDNKELLNALKSLA